jgi:hypothetical protein
VPRVCTEYPVEASSRPPPGGLWPPTLPLAGEGENPCVPALSPAGTRPHIEHCQGMVEAWVGYLVGFSAPAFAKFLTPKPTQ